MITLVNDITIAQIAGDGSTTSVDIDLRLVGGWANPELDPVGINGTMYLQRPVGSSWENINATTATLNGHNLHLEFASAPAADQYTLHGSLFLRLD